MQNPRGSEWRKWDLHVHAPSTRLANNYDLLDGKPDWERFCKAVSLSDVAVIGITDYFKLDSFFEFVDKYRQFHPDDVARVFFPNLELRLPEVLNKDGQSVNIHLLFRPDITKKDADRFLSSLRTETTGGPSGRSLVCSDLETRAEFESATVSRKSIMDAVHHTFGAGVPTHENVLIITSAKGDGIRPGGKGSIKRKNLLSDEIDKLSHGFFAGPDSREYFLDTERLETNELVAAKPVFDGCDAHSFDDLDGRLGKSPAEVVKTHVTWVKADPTYAGLLQTFAEPASRVAIQLAEPDQKHSYQYISKITFTNTADFPQEIIFNRNLNSIIGSRSAGKSALLAFIAHAVDPTDAVSQQIDAGIDHRYTGPAAGKTWAEVDSIGRTVHWGDSGAATGKVIYVPQNSLFAISEQPERITAKIAPSVFRSDGLFKAAHDQGMAKVAALNDEVHGALGAWLSMRQERQSQVGQLRDYGDELAIRAVVEELSREMDRVKEASALSSEDLDAYQKFESQTETLRTRLAQIDEDLAKLDPYVTLPEAGKDPEIVDGAVSVTIQLRPGEGQLPEDLSVATEALRAAASENLERDIGNVLVAEAKALRLEQATNREVLQSLEMTHADVIGRHQATDELTEITAKHDAQTTILSQIEKRKSALKKLGEQMIGEASRIRDAIVERGRAIDGIKVAFDSSARHAGELSLGIEIDLDPESSSNLSISFNRSRVNEYIVRKGDDFDFRKAQDDPSSFMEQLAGGAIELNKGRDVEAVARAVFDVSNECRFTAELEGDRIGGFNRSSMTPGKRALFALTLILNEAQEPWPLLIDQPEDDLDSRSIYDTVVPYLMTRKRERQIIMVSHDANLVIGADSEEVIVANRHGVDRPNTGGRLFEYLTGSLEHTQTVNVKSPNVLGRQGIREHACEILDGGTEAFQKRKAKYHI